jgi:hypothetical protein
VNQSLHVHPSSAVRLKRPEMVGCSTVVDHDHIPGTNHGDDLLLVKLYRHDFIHHKALWPWKGTPKFSHNPLCLASVRIGHLISTIRILRTGCSTSSSPTTTPLHAPGGEFMGFAYFESSKQIINIFHAKKVPREHTQCANAKHEASTKLIKRHNITPQ